MKKKFLIILLFLAGVLNLAHSQNEYLMIVDVQSRFYKNTAYEDRTKKMIHRINQIIKKFPAENVIYIQATGKMLSVSLKGFKTEPILPAPELDKSLNIVSENIFLKTEGDAFLMQPITDFLNKHNAKKIIIVGLLAEKCIMETAIGGADKGFDIFIVKEAVLSKSQTKKEKTFRKMNKKGIKVLPLKDLL